MEEFPETLSKKTRDEFTLRVFFSSRLSNEKMIGHFIRFREEKRNNLEKIEKLYELSDKYNKDWKLFQNEQLCWKFVLNRAKMSSTMLIRWADECISDLRKNSRSEGEKG